MGVLTAARIVDEGLTLAADRANASRALVWLNKWLASQYAAFAWPFLYRESAATALAAGASSLEFGSGAVVTPKVQRLNDPIKIYNASYSVQSICRLRTVWEPSSFDGSAAVNPSTNRGIPDSCRAKPSTTVSQKWTLQFNRVADRALLLEISYLEQPDDVVSAGIPLYPNDRTMIHAVMTDALRFKKGGDDPEYMDAREMLASMTLDDRAKFGMSPGLNTMLGLDPKTFR